MNSACGFSKDPCDSAYHRPKKKQEDSLPGHHSRGVWSQALGHVCGSASNQRCAQVNRSAEAAACIGVHTATDSVPCFQNNRLHATPLHELEKLVGAHSGANIVQDRAAEAAACIGVHTATHSVPYFQDNYLHATPLHE